MSIDVNTIILAFVMMLVFGMFLAAAIFMTRDPKKRYPNTF